MKIFFYGFTYPFKCIHLFFRYPKLIAISIIPIFVNIAIYWTAFFLTYSKIAGYSGSITGAEHPDAGFWSELLQLLFLVVTALMLLIICYFIFVIAGSIITAPFNENLSLIIEEKTTGMKSDYNPGFIKDISNSMGAELKKISFYIAILFVIFLLGVIPIIGSILSVVLGTVFSFFYNALDFIDYPMTRRYYTLRQKIKIVYSKFPLSMGFGCTAFLLMFLPVINVFLKPICVAGGTALFFEKKYIPDKNK